MLTQILQIRRLLNQPINLHIGIQLLSGPKVSARKFLLDATKHLQRARILDFLGLCVVGRRDGRAVPRAAACHGAHFGGGGVAHDGLAAFRGEVGFGRGFTAVAEAPG